MQLKNLINALFSSKSNGTKHFTRGDTCTFGWQTIMDLYQRELARVTQNCTRMVTRLKEAHSLRDAWTKLDVHPAKIMQVSYIIYFIYYLSGICSKNKCWGNFIGTSTRIHHPKMCQQQRRPCCIGGL